MRKSKAIVTDNRLKEAKGKVALQRVSDVRVRILGKRVEGDGAANDGVSIDDVIHSLFNGFRSTSCDKGCLARRGSR